uniref:Uncharacterized protein n=1 Tax=Setaria digitata TaxID=48799 RepID=A0A915PZN9_9BILA
MLYSHVTLLMLRVVDVVAKKTVQQTARMLVAEIPGDVQGKIGINFHRIIDDEITKRRGIIDDSKFQDLKECFSILLLR